MLKAIFFDAAGTLIHLPRPVGEHYAEVATRFGAAWDPTQVDRAFRAAWASSPERISDHRPRADDDRGWWRDLVSRVLTYVLTPPQRAKFDAEGYFDAVYAHFAQPGVWAAYPEASEVLGVLRGQGLALGVISNFDRRLYPVFDNLGLTRFFDHIVISSEIGADKPDPFIFQCTLERFGVDPQEAMHVGDDPKRDWGAETLGLHIFRLERPTVTLRDVIALATPLQTH